MRDSPCWTTLLELILRAPMVDQLLGVVLDFHTHVEACNIPSPHKMNRCYTNKPWEAGEVAQQLRILVVLVEDLAPLRSRAHMVHTHL